MSPFALLRVGGIVFAAVSLIVVGDTAAKLLTAEGVPPSFVAFARFALPCVLFVPLSGVSLVDLWHFADWRVLLRGLCITGGILSIIAALETEPIANVFGAFFIGPIVSYVLAVIFLGERPSQLRTLLLALGFIGVMLVVKPGFGATPGIGFALLAGTFYGAFLALTRAVTDVYRARFLLLSQFVIGALALAPLGVTVEAPPLSAELYLLIGVSALASACGNYLILLANVRAEASLIAPLIYMQLITATVLGGLVFSEWPDALALIGLAMIATSGLGALLARPKANGEDETEPGKMRVPNG
ncbi:MAG: DMT family transporter [Pseudomonadota bacterium]